MPITPKTLRLAGFTEYDPRAAEHDPHCVGFFQKALAGVLLDVSLWHFPGVRGHQVNFETHATDHKLCLDLGMRGVPKRWTVAELETYVALLLKRIQRPPQGAPQRRRASS